MIQNDGRNVSRRVGTFQIFSKQWSKRLDVFGTFHRTCWNVSKRFETWCQDGSWDVLERFQTCWNVLFRNVFETVQNVSQTVAETCQDGSGRALRTLSRRFGTCWKRFETVRNVWGRFETMSERLQACWNCPTFRNGWKRVRTVRDVLERVGTFLETCSKRVRTVRDVSERLQTCWNVLKRVRSVSGRFETWFVFGDVSRTCWNVLERFNTVRNTCQDGSRRVGTFADVLKRGVGTFQIGLKRVRNVSRCVSERLQTCWSCFRNGSKRVRTVRDDVGTFADVLERVGTFRNGSKLRRFKAMSKRFQTCWCGWWNVSKCFVTMSERFETCPERFQACWGTLKRFDLAMLETFPDVLERFLDVGTFWNDGSKRFRWTVRDAAGTFQDVLERFEAVRNV